MKEVAANQFAADFAICGGGCLWTDNRTSACVAEDAGPRLTARWPIARFAFASCIVPRQPLVAAKAAQEPFLIDVSAACGSSERKLILAVPFW